MFKVIAATLIVFISSFPAFAQEREYQPGINHKTIYIQPKVSAPQKPTPPKAEKPSPIAPQKTGSAEDTEESSTDRIWNKYKELATGTAKDEEETSAEDKKPLPPPDVEEVSQTDTAPTNTEEEIEEKNTGLKYLLEQYQNNKDQQRQMRTRTFKTPTIKTPDTSS